MFKKVRKIAPAAALSLFGLVAAGLVGCGSNSSIGPGSSTSSRVRLLNAIVGVPGASVDFYNGNKVINAQDASNINVGVAYGAVQPIAAAATQSTYRYVQSTNDTSYQVYPTNTFTPGTSATPLASDSFSLNPHNVSTSGTDTGGTYTLVAYGVYGSTDSTVRPKLAHFQDSPPTTIPTGQAVFRVIHVAPGVGTGSNSAVSVYSDDTNRALIGSITYGNQSFASGSNYFAIPVGTYNMSIRSEDGATRLISFRGTFQDGVAYSIYVVGQTGSGSAAPAILSTIDYPYEPGSRNATNVSKTK